MVLKKVSKKKAKPEIEEEIEEIEEAIDEEEIEEEDESPKIWSVKQVPIQTETAIYNDITGEHLTVHEAMVRMLNQFEVA